MYYNHQLRTNLQEWKNRFIKSDFDSVYTGFRYLFERLYKEPVVISLFEELANQHPYTIDNVLSIIDKNIQFHIFESEINHISFNYHFCKWLLQEKKDFRYMMLFGSSGNEEVEYYKDNVVEPLINYIHDRLNDISYVLYILQKYKLRTEWFTKKELLAEYEDATKNYEELLEENLRLFLFDQGIDYPFSTPKSASGRADVVSLIDTEDPLVLEIKIYDSAKGYKKERIQSGFAQIVKYAQDYHKDTGYLVVFNMDNIEIVIEGKEADNKWPNRYIFNGKTYYIIFINMNNEVSASKQGILKKETISFDELTKNI